MLWGGRAIFKLGFVCGGWQRLRSVCGALLLCPLAALAAGEPAADDVRLQCELTYAGATESVLARPVADPYTVPAVDVRGRFRFKPVLVGTPGRLERVNLYIYLETPAQPVLVQQAKYLPPFDWPADGRPLRLTGEQRVYAGPLERELIYNCQLLRGAP